MTQGALTPAGHDVKGTLVCTMGALTPALVFTMGALTPAGHDVKGNSGLYDERVLEVARAVA